MRKCSLSFCEQHTLPCDVLSTEWLQMWLSGQGGSTRPSSVDPLRHPPNTRGSKPPSIRPSIHLLVHASIHPNIPRPAHACVPPSRYSSSIHFVSVVVPGSVGTARGRAVSGGALLCNHNHDKTSHCLERLSWDNPEPSTCHVVAHGVLQYF